MCCVLFGLKVIMSSLSSCSTSRSSSTSQSSSTCRSSSISKPSFSMLKEVVSPYKDSTPSGVLVVRTDDPNAVEESSGDSSLGDPPLRVGYYWVSDQVLTQSSKYRWFTSLEYCVASVPMVVPEVERGFVSTEKCSVNDRVCFGREDSEFDFFFMYSSFFTDVHVRLPLDEFTIGVLPILNVAPTQLHPNSWRYLQSFRLLCEMFDLIPSPQSFLHYYRARPSTPTRWVSLVSQSGTTLFAPYIVDHTKF